MAADPNTPLVQARLRGTSGNSAVVGEVLKAEEGLARWKLHPAFAAWFWPLMSRVNELVLQVPEKLLEPALTGDSRAAPLPPDDQAKNAILKLAERDADCVRVFTLAMRGKPALVYKGFPTRRANLAILRRYRNGLPAAE